MATTISDDLLRKLAPVRETGAHKGGVGGVMIVAGAPHYPGAAWLTARSAGRNGAGIVYLAAPRSVISIMASAMPEVAFVPLPETESASSARRAIERMDEKQERVNAWVIGPGLGDDESTGHLLSALFGFGGGVNRSLSGFGFGAEAAESGEPESIFGKTDAPVVVDADGLNWLAKQPEWWKHLPAHRLVLTPHPKEANRLGDVSVESIVANPVEIAEKLAQRWNQTVVIKAGYTAVSNGSETIVSDLAPTSLATAGSGDCFAGAVGAFLAQGCSPLDAATLAIGIGCRAAVYAERTFGTAGVLASDMPDMMAVALNGLIYVDDSGER